MYPKKLSAEECACLDKEMQLYIDQGWLVETPLSDLKRIVPIIPVPQPHKPSTPIRPVFDFTDMNRYIPSDRDSEAAACNRSLRRWRTMSEAFIMDISKAYPRMGVEDELQFYQGVLWKGRSYRMTSLQMGHCNGPKYLQAVVHYLTAPFAGVDSYFDDLLIGGDGEGDASAILRVSSEVDQVLLANGFPTKAPTPLCGSTVLGLKVARASDFPPGSRPLGIDPSTLMWGRREALEELAARFPPDQMGLLSYKQLASFIGTLTSHVPVAGWLRCLGGILRRYVGRQAGQTKRSWAAQCDELAARLGQYVWAKLQEWGDPAVGVWLLPPKDTPVIVFTDASSYAIGVVIQDEQGHTLEDAMWLRKVFKTKSGKPSAVQHINIAELEGIERGIKRAIDMGYSKIRLFSDNEAVVSWVSHALAFLKINFDTASAILILRRLTLIVDTIKEYSIDFSISWVPTDENPADALTRVPADLDDLDGFHRVWDGVADDPSECFAAGGQFESATVSALDPLPASSLAALAIAPPSTPECSPALIKKVHDLLLHPGEKATAAAVQSIAGCKCSMSSVSAVVGSCAFCEHDHARPPPRVIPDARFRQLLADAPWKVVATDITKFLWGEFRHFILTAICERSRFLVARVVPSEQASAIWQGLLHIFSIFGFPEFLRSDRGEGFVALQRVTAARGIRQLLCTGNRATANGLVERVHRSMKARRRALVAANFQASAQKVVDLICYAYNITPHSALDMKSPAEVFFGRPFRTGLEPQPAATSPVSDVFAVGEQVWVRRPQAAGKRVRGDSTFLPGRYEVLSVKGRSAEVIPLGSSDKRRIMHAASDQLLHCKSIIAQIAPSISRSEFDDEDILDIFEQSQILGHDEGVARGDRDAVGGEVLEDDEGGDVPMAPQSTPAQALPPQPTEGRPERLRRPPVRFGIDDFIYER
jgi:ribonuclease HI